MQSTRFGWNERRKSLCDGERWGTRSRSYVSGTIRIFRLKFFEPTPNHRFTRCSQQYILRAYLYTPTYPYYVVRSRVSKNFFLSPGFFSHFSKLTLCSAHKTFLNIKFVYHYWLNYKYWFSPSNPVQPNQFYFWMDSKTVFTASQS